MFSGKDMFSGADMFDELLEKTNKVDEHLHQYVLIDKIEDEIKGLLVALKGDYWFQDDIKMSEISVLNWIKQNRPELYKKAIIDPKEVEGSDAIADALTALGLMKEWHDVGEDELQTPEDKENWEIHRHHDNE